MTHNPGEQCHCTRLSPWDIRRRPGARRLLSGNVAVLRCNAPEHSAPTTTAPDITAATICITPQPTRNTTITTRGIPAGSCINRAGLYNTPSSPGITPAIPGVCQATPVVMRAVAVVMRTKTGMMRATLGVLHVSLVVMHAAAATASEEAVVSSSCVDRNQQARALITHESSGVKHQRRPDLCSEDAISGTSLDEGTFPRRPEGGES